MADTNGATPPIGRCCSGKFCVAPTHELRNEHKCPKCNQIVHILCGVFDNTTDKYVCFPCSRVVPSPPTREPPQGGQPPPPSSTVSTRLLPRQPSLQKEKPSSTTSAAAKRCPACGGTDHQRRSSKKCKYYVAKPPVNKDSVICPPAITTTTTTAETTTKTTATLNTNEATVNNQTEATINNTTVINTNEDEDPEISKTNFINLSSSNIDYKPVIDVESKNFQPLQTTFKVSTKNHRGRQTTVEPTPSVLMEKYWNEEMIAHICKASNKYREARKEAEPNLYCWKSKSSSREFTPSCIYHLLAMLYYFGICRLPTKPDYWSTDPYMPKHPLAHELGMTRDRFAFLWRHFHVYIPDNTYDDDDNVDGGDDEEDEELVEQGLERVQREQEEELVDDESQEDNEETTKVWFEKIQHLVDHVREVSYSLIHILGTFLSLDEMMIRFMGRSLQTHRIKNKPIKEGYKFFVLSTTKGFIVNFTPDGRTAEKKKEQEYTAGSLGKIESMILFVVEIINRIKTKQKERISKYNRASRRNNNSEQFDETVMKQFCIAMDNYFTLPGVIAKLREMGIGIVGTARFRRNWPPKKLKEVKPELANFNDFYHLADDNGTLCARWMDNGLVFCVSTIHKIGSIVKACRKRPRITNKNNNHVKKVWGDHPKKDIYIPKLIDDYNHWMGGVDLSDQRIAYYHPNLRSRRNWIPLFIQIMSIVRNNAYIIHREYFKKEGFSHKDFTLEIIRFLMNKAHGNLLVRRQSADKSKSPNPKVSGVKRRRVSPKANIEATLNDFPQRKAKPRELHIRVNHESNERGSCIYCSTLFSNKKAAGEDGQWSKEVKRTRKVCSFCSHKKECSKCCFLCKEHFDIFHDTP